MNMASGKARTAGVVVSLGLLVAAAYYFSRPAYPKISPQAYRCATALYTACNQQSQDKLVVLERLIAESLESGQLTAQEAGWLRAIIGRANEGEWQAAAGECRELMECQVDHGAELAQT